MRARIGERAEELDNRSRKAGRDPTVSEKDEIFAIYVFAEELD